MRNLLLILLAASAITTAQAQLTYSDAHIYTKYTVGKLDTAVYNNFSIAGEYFVNEYIGLNYDFELQFRDDNVRHFHTSIGALAGPPLILIGAIATASNGSDGDDDTDGDGVGDSDFNLGPLGILLGVAILIAPDGVTFHIPVSYKWDIAPYANVLGVDYVWRRNDFRHFKYAMSFGVKGTYLLRDRYTLNLFAETRKVAGQKWGFGGGFGVGFVLGSTSYDSIPEE
jgi:hypothetical protein